MIIQRNRCVMNTPLWPVNKIDTDFNLTEFEANSDLKFNSARM